MRQKEKGTRNFLYQNWCFTKNKDSSKVSDKKHDIWLVMVFRVATAFKVLMVQGGCLK